MKRASVIHWLPFVFLTACQVPHIPEEHLPDLNGASVTTAPQPVYETVTRQEAIRMARRYAGHRWKPTAANVWHGVDPDGVRVDTPDASFKARGIRPGWWVPGQVNQGVPYQWGGFSSIEEFDAGLRKGMAAGDLLSDDKQAMIELNLPNVSPFAVGIGASGLISRCWKLPRYHSTQELAALCETLPSYDDLLPGDILNLPGTHVILVEQFADERRRAILAYEAGSPPSWKVVYNHMPISHLKRLGYQPQRFRYIEGSPDDAEVLGLRRAQPEPAVTPPPTMDDPNLSFL